MAKAKVKSEGIIAIRFPPPVPENFGKPLRSTLHRVLGQRVGISTIDTGEFGGVPGWAFEVRVKDASGVRAAVDTLVAILRRERVPDATTIEFSERRGPVDVSPGPDLAENRKLAGLYFAEAQAAWADVYVDGPPPPSGHDAHVQALRAALSDRATFDHEYPGSMESNVIFKVSPLAGLGRCLEALLEYLRADAALAATRVSACSETDPIKRPVYGEDA